VTDILSTFVSKAGEARATAGQPLFARCSTATIHDMAAAIRLQGPPKGREWLAYCIGGIVVAGPGLGYSVACVDGIDIACDDTLELGEIVFVHEETV
jgi:hypothetical protein